MTTDKDLSSTEKLLSVIRKGSSNDDPGQPAAGKVQSRGLKGKALQLGSRDIVGVEITGHGLGIVKMTRSGKSWKATQAFSVPMKKGLTLDSPDISSFIAQSLQRVEGIKKAAVWALIPAEKGEIWQISVPRVKKDLHNAVYWSAKKEKDFDENASCFDYRILDEIIDSGARKLAVEVFIAPRSEVDLLKKVFANAGFPLEGITLSTFALHNLFVSNMIDSGGKPVALLSIGQGYSYIDIYQQNRVLLNRFTKTGMGSMVQSILEDQDLELATDIEVDIEAEEHPELSPALQSSMEPEKALELMDRLIKEDQASPGDTMEYPPDRIFSMISPVLERLARQVERTVDHSINVLKNPAPAQLYICGDLAASSRFIDFFQEQLGLNVQALDPLNPSLPYISISLASLKQRERLALVQATGLAVSSNDYTPNFLFTSKDREVQRTQKRNGILAAALVMVILLVAGGFYYQSHQEMVMARQNVESLTQQLEAKSPRLSQEIISSMAGDFSQKTSTLRDFSRKFVPMAAMSEITAITPANVQLLSVRLDMGRAVASDRGSQAKIMVIDGFITGDEVLFETYLSSYLFRIRSSRLFGDTEIHRSSTEEFGTEGQVMRFTINVNLRQV